MNKLKIWQKVRHELDFNECASILKYCTITGINKKGERKYLTGDELKENLKLEFFKILDSLYSFESDFILVPNNPCFFIQRHRFSCKIYFTPNYCHF